MEIGPTQEILEHKREATRTTASVVFTTGSIVAIVLGVGLTASHVLKLEAGSPQVHLIAALFFLVQVAVWILLFEMKVRAIGKAADAQAEATNLLRSEIKLLRESLSTKIRTNDEVLQQIIDPFSATAGGSPELEDRLKKVILHYPKLLAMSAQSPLDQEIIEYAFSYLDQAANALKDKSRRILWDGQAIREYPAPYYKKEGLTRIRATNLGYINDSNGFFRVGKKDLVQANVDCALKNTGKPNFSICRIFIITNQILDQKEGRDNDIQMLYEVMAELANSGIQIKLMIDERVQRWLHHVAEDFTLFEWETDGHPHRLAGVLQSQPGGSAWMNITVNEDRMRELGQEFDSLWESNLGAPFRTNDLKNIAEFRKLLRELCC